jgi:hypothetical protein
MCNHTVPGNVPQDSFVGGRRTAAIVLGLESVDGNYQVQLPDPAPMRGNFSYSTRHELNFNILTRELWQ